MANLVLKSMKDRKAVGFILSHLGLVAASAILVGIVFGFAAVNVWQADAEAYNVALDFSRSVDDGENSLVENDLSWCVADFESISYLEIDSNEVCVFSQSFFGQKILRRNSFDSENVVLLNSSLSDSFGFGYEDIHQNFLKTKFNHFATFDDALNFSDAQNMFDFFSMLYKKSIKKPLVLSKDDCLLISTVRIFFLNESHTLQSKMFVFLTT